MISSFDAAKAINDVRGDAVVVGTMTPKPVLGVGVGEARSRPAHLRRDGEGVVSGAGNRAGAAGQEVLCLDGDGALLMNLGTLVTIAETAPRTSFTSCSRTGSIHDGRPADTGIRQVRLRGDGGETRDSSTPTSSAISRIWRASCRGSSNSRGRCSCV